MKFFSGKKQYRHSIDRVFVLSGSRPSRDKPERHKLLMRAAVEAGLEHVEVTETDPDCLIGLHSSRYLEFLRTIYADWVEEFGVPEYGVIANVFPTQSSRHGAYPRTAAGRIGIHMHDQLAPVFEHTYEAAVESATVARDAARAVLEGDTAAYALCRPSGHHAGYDNGGGATYLNNAGVAAQTLRSTFDRVLVVDVDVHHGNGTQDVFYSRNDVFFISLHRDTIDYHPYHWGYRHEQGTGDGLGYNLNVPLRRDTGDDDYVKALDEALDQTTSFHPQALVISLGYDAHKDDPSAGLQLTFDGFERIGRRFRAMGLPTVVVQEGGYNLDIIGQCLTAFFKGFGVGR